MRIAVIGTGIAGLGAAWALSRKHEVTVYEADDRIGGHANTATIDTPAGPEPVDTGFIVFNDRTYPNLNALFSRLGVPIKPSTMSFSVSARGGAVEYAGTNLDSLFACRRNLLRPSHYRMIADILRFYRKTTDMVARNDLPGGSLRDLLADGGYSDAFVYDHILPMAAAIWSADIREILSFPAASFLRFFSNHGLLTVNDQPQWLTVDGGSREYVRRLVQATDAPFHLKTPVKGIRRSVSGIEVLHDGTGPALFDQVVLATHADTSLSLLIDADPFENAVLSRFGFQPNTAILHTDVGLMPRRRRAWASWNFNAPGSITDGTPVSVTYWMNRLQSLQGMDDVFVSLNPVIDPAPDTVLGRYSYDHPVFDADAIAAQQEIGKIQGRRGVWVCGAWCGFGFHEDGLASAMAVARALGAAPPWRIDEVSSAAANTRPVSVFGPDQPDRTMVAAE